MSEIKEPKIGDVVQLISGGPEMTVQKVADNISGRKNIHCIWYNYNNNHYVENTFDSEVLAYITK